MLKTDIGCRGAFDKAFDSTETPTLLAFTRLFLVLDLDVHLLSPHYKNNIRVKPPALRLNYCNAYMYNIFTQAIR